MKDEHMRKLVEKELEGLRLGVQIAKLREQEKLTQTELAAKAEMSTPKISVIENNPKDVKVGTLIRLAHALNRELEIRFRPKRNRGLRLAKEGAH
jgi:transcriptional regulator with XRE-family HTH domain